MLLQWIGLLSVLIYLTKWCGMFIYKANSILLARPLWKNILDQANLTHEHREILMWI